MEVVCVAPGLAEMGFALALGSFPDHKILSCPSDPECVCMCVCVCVSHCIGFDNITRKWRLSLTAVVMELYMHAVNVCMHACMIVGECVCARANVCLQVCVCVCVSK